MIKHVVCFKLKEYSLENMEKAREVILSMNGKVKGIKQLEVGIDLIHSQRSFDVVLEVLVDDLDALDRYQKDEYHCNVVKKYLGEVTINTIAIDYYI